MGTEKQTVNNSAKVKWQFSLGGNRKFSSYTSYCAHTWPLFLLCLQVCKTNYGKQQPHKSYIYKDMHENYLSFILLPAAVWSSLAKRTLKICLGFLPFLQIPQKNNCILGSMINVINISRSGYYSESLNPVQVYER